MTRLELLQLVVGRARTNGFEFRRWYTGRLGLPWISVDAALVLLDAQRRYYALVFSHEFAQTFWKPGSEISFDVEAQTFQRTMGDGSVREVRRKGFIRRSVRPNAWKYHLRQMALAEEPLRHLRKYLHVEEELDTEEGPAKKRGLRKPRAKSADTLAGKRRGKATPRPLPTGIPQFLQRPYLPASGKSGGTAV